MHLRQHSINAQNVDFDRHRAHVLQRCWRHDSLLKLKYARCRQIHRQAGRRNPGHQQPRQQTITILRREDGQELDLSAPALNRPAPSPAEAQHFQGQPHRVQVRPLVATRLNRLLDAADATSLGKHPRCAGGLVCGVFHLEERPPLPASSIRNKEQKASKDQLCGLIKTTYSSFS